MDVKLLKIITEPSTSTLTNTKKHYFYKNLTFDLNLSKKEYNYFSNSET